VVVVVRVPLLRLLVASGREILCAGILVVGVLQGLVLHVPDHFLHRVEGLSLVALGHVGAVAWIVEREVVPLLFPPGVDIHASPVLRSNDQLFKIYFFRDQRKQDQQSNTDRPDGKS
jgi:hypothetical protein